MRNYWNPRLAVPFGQNISNHLQGASRAASDRAKPMKSRTGSRTIPGAPGVHDDSFAGLLQEGLVQCEVPLRILAFFFGRKRTVDLRTALGLKEPLPPG